MSIIRRLGSWEKIDPLILLDLFIITLKVFLQFFKVHGQNGSPPDNLGHKPEVAMHN